MAKKILIVLVVVSVLIGAFVVVVALQPGELRIERKATIAAPADVVFAHVNDFHQWDAWSPWARLDPQMKQTYEGAAAGEGAIYTWTGNSDVGAGKMTITESLPGQRVRIDLEFTEPFASANTTEFVFQPQGDGTAVAWTMTGKNNFMSKAFGLFVDMDKMIGADFEKGLASLKSAAEAAAAADEGAPARGPSSDDADDDESTPAKPDNRVPGNRAPDTRAPDTRAPDTRAPDNRAPDNRAPDNRAPDNRAPDNRAPDNRAPDNRAPDNRAR